MFHAHQFENCMIDDWITMTLASKASSSRIEQCKICLGLKVIDHWMARLDNFHDHKK